GTWAIVVLLACALAVGAVAVCFAEGGSRVPSSGGAYAYIANAFGPMNGHIVGTMLWFSNLLADGGIAAALGDTVASVAPPAATAAVRALVIVGVIGGIAVVNLLSVRAGVRLLGGATVVKMLPLAAFLLFGASGVRAANLGLHSVGTANLAGIGRAGILAVFAYMGMEGALCASGEVRDPSRNIPRALFATLGLVTALYLAIQVVAQGILGAALAGSAAPLADAIARVNPGLRGLLILGTSLSLFGWLCSDILSTPRVVFAGARDGLLPRVFGRVAAGRGTPYVAIIAYASAAAAIALAGGFTELAVLSALAMAPVYVGGCLAAVSLKRRGVALAGAPLGFRGLGVAAAVGVGSMILMVAMASRAEILGLCAALALSALGYAISRRGAAVRFSS
ncbi:MAG: APC family permease, partial [Gammaproteobacteria bacterium]|nr:APC family permease [Gammaproteobacteria bacterium]